VPAAPGWYLGELVGIGKEIEEATALDLRPIIAWEIERERDTWHRDSGYTAGTPKITFDTFPICADGMTTTRWREYVLRSPDGKYWSREGGALEDEADAIRHLKWNGRFSLAHHWRKPSCANNKRCPTHGVLLAQHANDPIGIGASLAQCRAKQRTTSATRQRSEYQARIQPIGSCCGVAHGFKSS